MERLQPCRMRFAERSCNCPMTGSTGNWPSSVGGSGRSSRANPNCRNLVGASEWAELAVLQSRWKWGQPKLGVDYSAGRVVIDLCNESRLFFGDATPTYSFNGRSLALESELASICWNQDDEVDYLELEATLESGAIWQRQFLLARGRCISVDDGCSRPTNAGSN